MSAWGLSMGIVLLVFAIAIIIVVLLQEGQQQPMGAMTGGMSDTFLERNKSRSINAFLERWTKFISIGFMIAVIVVDVLSYMQIIK